MDELIRMVSERAGIGEDAARAAVQTVLDFLKDRLPEPIAGQIDNVLGAGRKEKSGGVAGGIGDILGRS
ncbi:MAG TPA: DUF2267 domain-containing protein [Chloroflexi bacterium]|jgi:uncharacterized protein (DUF2267 family)|nr:DUF2267 domain-containing protein [Chloroflexota bacterium]